MGRAPCPPGIFEGWVRLPLFPRRLLCSVQSLGPVGLFVAPWTVVSQAPLSMGSSRQEYWVAIPFSRDLPHPGLELASLMSPALGRRVVGDRTHFRRSGCFARAQVRFHLCKRSGGAIAPASLADSSEAPRHQGTLDFYFI